jgi:RNA polymerase sigma-70 factor (sigma-E family)
MALSRGTLDFEEFAKARTPQLYRTAWLLAGEHHLAEDLVQETLAKLYRAWRRVEQTDNPAAYAQTVLARTYISQRRKKSSTERPVPRTPDRADTQGDPALRLSLMQALAELAPLDRAVLVLRYFEDRSPDQVADVLGKNSGAIRTRTSRALDRLRAVLGDEVVHLAAH